MKSQSTLVELVGGAHTDIDRSSEQAKNVTVEVNNFEEYSNRCDIMKNE